MLRTCPHRGRKKRSCCIVSERSDPPVIVAGKYPPFLDDFQRRDMILKMAPSSAVSTKWAKEICRERDDGIAGCW